MKKMFSAIIFLLFLVAVGCEKQETIITNFEECVAAGNPVMESYPRQCRAGDQTFTEVISMTLEEARDIAQNSDCVAEGSLKDTSFHNENTQTWWIDLDIEKEGCNPACVVNEVTKEAEINWRCTGLLT